MHSLSTPVGIGVAFGAAAFTLIVLLRFLRGNRRRERPVHLAGADAGGSAPLRWEEKRRHPRVAVSWDAELEEAGTRRTARLRDISRGGAFVVVSAPPAAGHELRLKIFLPHAAPLVLNASVAWSNAAVPEERVVHRGMGVIFRANAAEDLRRLHEAILGLLSQQEEAP